MFKPHFNFRHFLTLLAIVSFFVIFSPVFTGISYAANGVPRTINFQGRLVTNPGGVNVANGTVSIVFSLYNNASGGTAATALWSETQSSVTVTDGIFRVVLGSQTPIPANFNFNWDGLYLGVNVAANGEMTPRIQMASVPFAFNAQQVAGLTVQDTSGNASTSGTLQIANAKTINLGTDNLTFTTGGTTTLTLPTTGTLLTNTTAANQTITSTQTTGNVLSLADSTGLTSAITGLTVGLTASTNSQNKTGISFDLSGGTGGTYYDLLGTGSTWNITRAGVLSVASCSGCGGGTGVNWWNQLGGVLSPLNTTNDFVLGATATSSALFSYTGIKTGQTIASASGNLILMPNNGWGGKMGIGYNNPGTGALTVNGNVGIGTTTPKDNLTLGSGTAESSLGLMSSLTNGLFFSTFQNTAYLSINRRSSDGSFVNTSYGAASIGFASTTSGGYFDFNTANTVNTNPTFAMRINSDGNVGIGTQTPKAKLDVNGNASVSGGLTFDSTAASLQSTKNQGLTIGGNSTGNITISPSNGTGIVTVGTATNGLTFDVTNGGPTYNGTGRITKRITLTPEYAGASLTADGTSNTGSMTSDNQAASPYRNFYKWTNTQGTAQDYDIWVTVPLPADYSAMAATPTLSIDTYSSDLTNGTVLVTVYDTSNVADCTSQAFTPTGAINTWESKTATTCLDTGTYAANGIVKIKLHVTGAATTGDTRVSTIYFDYLAKF